MVVKQIVSMKRRRGMMQNVCRLRWPKHGGHKLLDFMLTSSSFSSSELLSSVEKICDKISRKYAPSFTDSKQPHMTMASALIV